MPYGSNSCQRRTKNQSEILTQLSFSSSEAQERRSLPKTTNELSETVINAVGKTTVRRAAALLKCCQLFIGNDVKPVHLAAVVSILVAELSCYPKFRSHYSSKE